MTLEFFAVFVVFMVFVVFAVCVVFAVFADFGNETTFDFLAVCTVFFEGCGEASNSFAVCCGEFGLGSVTLDFFAVCCESIGDFGVGSVISDFLAVCEG